MSSVRSSAWTPGNQVFQVASEAGPARGCDLGPQVVRCWSAHAAAPRVVHRHVHKCGEAAAWCDHQLRGHCPIGRFGEVPDARGRPERRGRGRYQRRREPHKPRQWASSTPSSAEKRAAGEGSPTPQVGAPDCFAGRDAVHSHRRAARGRTCHRAVSRSRCRAAPQGPSPRARAFEEAMREEDVPAEQPEAEEEARLPPPDADTRPVARDRTSAAKGRTRLSA